MVFTDEVPVPRPSSCEANLNPPFFKNSNCSLVKRSPPPSWVIAWTEGVHVTLCSSVQVEGVGAHEEVQADEGGYVQQCAEVWPLFPQESHQGTEEPSCDGVLHDGSESALEVVSVVEGPFPFPLPFPLPLKPSLPLPLLFPL